MYLHGIYMVYTDDLMEYIVAAGLFLVYTYIHVIYTIYV